MKQKKQKKKSIKDRLGSSPINFFSDLFIVAMVLLWIVDNVYESVIATIVTLSSLSLSFEVGYSCIDTSMWSSIGSNIAIPLSAGGALWMLKNGVQHAIANKAGRQPAFDFPAIHPDGESDEIEMMKCAAEEATQEAAESEAKG